MRIPPHPFADLSHHRYRRSSSGTSNLAATVQSEEVDFGGGAAKAAAEDHIPVLLREVLHTLIQSDSGVYVDGTYGRGGHCRSMLARLASDAQMIGLDRDPEAVAAAQGLVQADSRFSIFHGRFSQLADVLSDAGVVGGAQGILLDIGVSSPQLDDASRGFSFNADGPLDMRMDPTEGISAAEWLNVAAEEDIAKVIFIHGEERNSRRIAKNIVAARPLTTTLELADIVEACVPRNRNNMGKHPATKTFQAIRIFINEEDRELREGLQHAFAALAVGGRLAVISFHSLEDRQVKHVFRGLSRPPSMPRRLPVRHTEQGITARLIGKSMKAQSDELATNPRARSATLRVIERIC
ncbi:MAG: 16S rRNA (cytosine1402-N4)-methyltransferase [Candidatus Azotimanducaceae bacterium]